MVTEHQDNGNYEGFETTGDNFGVCLIQKLTIKSAQYLLPTLAQRM